MASFVLATEEELVRARSDPAFRQQLLAKNLDYLLSALNRLRSVNAAGGSASATQIREGVQLAVRLADILGSLAGQIGEPQATLSVRTAPSSNTAA
jgi:hypothetical protein